MQLAEAWDARYSGKDAAGAQVIALWQFEPGAEMADSSGHGHGLILQGAKPAAVGRFGGGLQSFRSWPEKNEQHAVTAINDSSLTPKGAFTLEMWIRPAAELEGYPESYLLDKKYVAQADYQLILTAADARGERSLRVNLGFGSGSGSFTCEPDRYEPGVWHHLAFTYDGAGTGRLYRDGRYRGGGTLPGRGPVFPGVHPLVIADRVGSYFHGFPGIIDEVRISNAVLEFRPAVISVVSDRTVFVRMEKALMRVSIANSSRLTLSGAKAWLSQEGAASRELALPDLASGAATVKDCPIDTNVRPGVYRLTAQIKIPGDPPYVSEEHFPYTIVARLPARMPVVMWGSSPLEAESLKDIGFTHCFGLTADLEKIWKQGAPTEAGSPAVVSELKLLLDKALADGLGVIAEASPGAWARSKEEYRRVGRDGTPYEKADVCGNFPLLQSFSANVGTSLARTYGTFPAFQAALVNTEVRDRTQLCFHPHDLAAFKKFSGFDIPAEASTKWGTPHKDLTGFPADRVIPDNYPLYVFYKWFWKQGDGWNALHTAVSRGLHSTGRADLWTWHDPAVRTPSVWGSGGEVDVLSHWTYTYPDPIRIGLTTDELFTMASGGPEGQKVMNMIQLIWYRSQTAPQTGETPPATTSRFDDRDTAPTRAEGEAAAVNRAWWERELPDTRFLTVAPMHLREAFWTEIARPLQGLMFYPWQALVEAGESADYHVTNKETRNELQRLLKTVVEPLGPTLLQVPDRKADVAFLESFASQMFAQRGTYGWSEGWEGDMYLILAYAQLQAQVVTDESISQRGLEGFRILVMPNCDVLTQTVARKVREFQLGGGIVVGDERLCPAVKPDILIKAIDRPREADKARRLLQEAAARLREQLKPRLSPYFSSLNPDIVTRARRYGSTDYLFVVNDQREFGDYVGHHGLVMENGLPSETTLALDRRSGYVYDLLGSRSFPMTTKSRIEIHERLGPCEGRVFMVTERAIADLRVEAPASLRAGETAALRISVVDESGIPLDAIVPVRVDILDPEGSSAEFSGFYGAKDGQLSISINIAPNELRGMWQVRVKELASGRAVDAFFRVTGENSAQ